MEEGLKPKDFAPWLGSRIYGLAQLEPTLRLDDTRSVLLRGSCREHPRSMRASGLLVDTSDEQGLLTVVHEWHGTGARGTGTFGHYPNCGYMQYVLKGEELVSYDMPNDPHIGTDKYAATAEAGRLQKIHGPLFDPLVTDRARRAVQEVLGGQQHAFVDASIAAGLGRLGLQVAPAAV